MAKDVEFEFDIVVSLSRCLVVSLLKGAGDV